MRSQTIIFGLFLAASVFMEACGDNHYAFRNSGDNTNYDIVPTPCPNCEPPPGGYSQGEDLFFQTPPDGRVDILFVDDNSGSMRPEQEHLGSRFPNFTAALGNLDWQVAVTTTDVSDGPYGIKGSILELAGRPGEKILRPTTPDTNTVFQHTIERPETLNCNQNGGQCPSGNEQPLFASILAIDKRASDNVGLFRNGADLSVVILSDEDEMSNAPPQATRGKDVIDKFKSVWGREKKFTVFSIIVIPGDKSCLDAQRAQNNSGEYGTRAHELTQMTGGEMGSICDADFSQTVAKIGEKVLQLTNAFELAHVPEPNSVTVTLDPAQPSVTWKTTGNKLLFTPAPQQGTKINAKYIYKN